MTMAKLPESRKEKLLRQLEEAQYTDPENGHSLADDALIEFINDTDITTAYEKLERWYA